MLLREMISLWSSYETYQQIHCLTSYKVYEHYRNSTNNYHLLIYIFSSDWLIQPKTLTRLLTRLKVHLTQRRKENERSKWTLSDCGSQRSQNCTLQFRMITLPPFQGRSPEIKTQELIVTEIICINFTLKQCNRYLNLMFIGPCIIVIVEEQKTNLMSLAILFHFLCTQHVSDINMCCRLQPATRALLKPSRTKSPTHN